MDRCCVCGEESRDLDYGTLGNDNIVGYCPKCTSNGARHTKETWKTMPRFVEADKADSRMARLMNRKVGK